MYNWYDRGIFQVIDKESGEALFETETTIEDLKKSMFNFELCDYQFIKYDYGYILNTEDIKELMEG